MSAPRATAAAPTVASRAIFDGQPAVASSFRFHRPRGPLCGRGYCGQCEIATGSGRALACEAAAGGAAARTNDPLRPLGRLAEAFPPWFYERRFLRPRRLRRASLHLLRYLSAAPPLGAAAARLPPREFAEVEAGVVAVGAPAPPGAFTVDPGAGDVVLGIYPERTLGLLRGNRLLAVAFERLVLDMGSYVRLPPVAGNDLPGVLALDAAAAYGEAGGLRRGTRAAVYGPQAAREQAGALARRHGLDVVWSSDVAPRAIAGRGRVRAVVADERVACDLFLVGVRQPALDLALQAGARAVLTRGELPILAAAETPEWLELVGDAAATSSRVPAVAADGAAIACPCEDVRVDDLRACVAQGFDHAELVKRRTGAMTGPCQGKVCAAAVLSVLRDAGVDAAPTRARPLLRPVALRELAADA